MMGNLVFFFSPLCFWCFLSLQNWSVISRTRHDRSTSHREPEMLRMDVDVLVVTPWRKRVPRLPPTQGHGGGAYFLRLGRWTWVSSPELALSLRKCKAIAKIRPAMVTSGHGKAGGKRKELSSSWTEGRKEAFWDSWHVWDMKIKGRTFWPH